MAATDVVLQPGPVPGQGASERLRQRFETFRRTHPYRETDVRGVRWRYLVSGRMPCPLTTRTNG